MITFLKSQANKLGILLIAASVAGVALLSVSFAPAFSGFTAEINNSQNTIGSGTLLMTETQGATTCLSSAAGTVTTSNSGTCTTINKFSGTTTAVPGTVYTSTVSIKNNGTVPANTFKLTPGGCAVSANGTTNGTDTAGFCGKVDITIADTTGTAACVFPSSASACAAPSSANTLTSLGTTPIALTTPLAPGATRTYTFSVALDTNATNDDQGLLATETLKWSFVS